MKNFSFIFIFIFLFYNFIFGTQEEKIPGNDFNEYVLSAMKSYSTNGKHKYYWPKSGSWAGNTQNLYYEGKIFSEGDPDKRCYCCGLTFEVFFLAYKKYCKDKGWPFTIKGFNSKALLKFRSQWFGSDGNRETLKNAIVSNGLGYSVKMEDAKAGDFVQLWRHSGSGHSVIFIGWIYNEDGEIIGMEYWSTQTSTNGIHYNTEYFGEKSGMKVDELYIARIGKK